MWTNKHKWHMLPRFGNDVLSKYYSDALAVLYFLYTRCILWLLLWTTVSLNVYYSGINDVINIHPISRSIIIFPKFKMLVICFMSNMIYTTCVTALCLALCHDTAKKPSHNLLKHTGDQLTFRGMFKLLLQDTNRANLIKNQKICATALSAWQKRPGECFLIIKSKKIIWQKTKIRRIS